MNRDEDTFIQTGECGEQHSGISCVCDGKREKLFVSRGYRGHLKVWLIRSSVRQAAEGSHILPLAHLGRFQQCDLTTLSAESSRLEAYTDMWRSSAGDSHSFPASLQFRASCTVACKQTTPDGKLSRDARLLEQDTPTRRPLYSFSPHLAIDISKRNSASQLPMRPQSFVHLAGEYDIVALSTTTASNQHRSVCIVKVTQHRTHRLDTFPRPFLNIDHPEMRQQT